MQKPELVPENETHKILLELYRYMYPNQKTKSSIN